MNITPPRVASVIDDLARLKMRENSALDYSKATRQVLAENPALAKTPGGAPGGDDADDDATSGDGVMCAKCGSSLVGGARGDSHPQSVQCPACSTLNDLSLLELDALDDQEAGGEDFGDGAMPSDVNDSDALDHLTRKVARTQRTIASRDASGAPASVRDLRLSGSEKKRLSDLLSEIQRRRRGWEPLL